MHHANHPIRREPVHRRREPVPIREPLPLWRAELPFGLLVAAALASPLLVLDQGGDWRLAVFAFCVVLSVPGAALEGMVGLARLARALSDGPR